MDDPKSKKPEITAPAVSQPPRDGSRDTHALEAELAALRAENSRLEDQARASLETAAGLTGANEALRRSASALAGIRSLDDFLAETLAAAIATTGARNGAVVLVQGDVAEHVVLMEGPARVPRARQERDGTCSFPISPELRAHLESTQDSGDVWAPPPDDASHTPAFIAYHRDRGNGAIRNVPLVVARRVIGWLGFGFAEAEPPAAWRVELLRALAEQTTVAVELSRLAGEAKEAAAAKEREAAARQRAAELAKANEALSRSINGLASFQDLQSFLTSVLREAISASGAVSGAVFAHEPADDTLRIVAHVLRGEALDVDRDPRNAAFRSPFPAREAPVWGIVCRERRAYWIDHADPVHDDWPLAKAWHDANGHRFVACIPMLLGDRADGLLWLAFDWAEAVQPAEARLELSRVLAQQGTLAVRLSRLMEQVHQAAIARARGQGAWERAAELGRANEALRRSVAKLAGACELGEFFTHALVATAEAVGAASAGLMRFDPARRAFRRFRHVADGRELPTGDGPPDREWRLEDPVIAEAWRAMTTGDCFLWCDPAAPTILPDTRAWYEALGHRAVALVPMRRGEDSVGLVALGFRSDTRPTPAQIELTQALVQQLTLAAELERLAEESKQTAIAREREQAARRRTAELAKANEALKWTTERLAREPQLEDYLGHVLLDACEHVRAAGGHLTIHDADRQVWRTAVLVEDGRLVDNPFAMEIPVGTGLIFDEVAREGRPRAYDLDAIRHLLWPGVYEYQAERGHASAFVVPLMVGAEALGSLGVASRSPHPISEEQSEYLQALARQAALAIQLTRLAEEAKRAAVAREREQAASARAAELERTNAALLQVFDALAADAGLDRVLDRILKAVAGLFEADYAALWLADPARRLVHLRAVCDRGVVIPGPDSGHPSAQAPVAYDAPHFARAMERLRHGPLFVESSDESTPTPEQSTGPAAAGVTRLLRIGMVVGDQALGEVTVRLTGASAPAPERVGVARALTQQAALAVYMDRLAAAGRHAAVAEERNRMAREIHDTLAQSFTGIFMQLQAAGELARSKPELTRACIARAESLARDGLREARRSVSALRPDAAEYADLPSALRRLVVQATAGTGTRAEVAVEGEARMLDPEVGLNLLRIAQEALGNAQRYASARLIRIRVAYDPGGVSLVVEDDGKGFDPASPAPDAGYGLTGMRQRAERLGGTFEITSATGRGTEVRVRAPHTRPEGRRQQ